MYAACSFHAILTQAIEQLRYRWYYACLRPTSHGLQGHLHFALCPSPFVVPPICLIFGRLCARSCESKESALIHVLMYLNVVLGYTLGCPLHGVYHGIG